MKKVSFDFQRPRAPVWSAAALLTAGVLAAAAAGYEYAEATARAAAWEVRLAELKRMAQRNRPAIGTTTRDGADLTQEIRLANVVLRQISLPWDNLFAELERSRGGSVTLLSVQPNVQARTVRIGGEAKSLRAVIEYAMRLDSSSVLHDVHVVRHELDARNPQRPVVFSLAAAWR